MHLIFKTHLDLGFTDLARNVVDLYFDRYFPAAIETAKRFRDDGSGDRFIWTTAAWLIYEYLERANAAERRRLETAIEAGDVAWHAMPFTVHSELLDPSLFRHGLSFSLALDRRFGVRTIAAKLTDVPGHTRGIVSLLAEAGVEFLHIGVNEASPVPDVPPLFNWEAPVGSRVTVMYQDSYGASTATPAGGDCVVFAHTKDNSGPQSEADVRSIYADLRRRLPGADVAASTLSDFARALRPHRDKLPTVTGEIGDTWIHGVASDPTKIARYRALVRLRARWLADGSVGVDDGPLRAASDRLLLVAEHTWGMDDKAFLADYENYSQEAFAFARGSERFRTIADSWREQRAYVDEAASMLLNSPRGADVASALDELRPEPPDLASLNAIGMEARPIETDSLFAEVSPRDGSMVRLHHIASGIELVDSRVPFGRVGMQLFTHEDYQRFLDDYLRHAHDWALADFGKPGLESTDVRGGWVELEPDGHWYGLSQTHHTVVVRLRQSASAHREHGGPAHFHVTYRIPLEGDRIEIDVQWFNLEASRIPQAYWFSFAPRVGDHARWRLRKLGQDVDPCDVVSRGNRSLHAIEDAATCDMSRASLRIETLDAPLVAAGRPALLRFPRVVPDMAEGLHFNLFNNTWGTNFPSWTEDDGKARFRVSVSARSV